jgi:hypothetical protein
MEAHLESMKLHITYLLSLENSERTRAGCVAYLQTWLLSFYPERPDLVKEAERLARELGGRLEAPRLSWKYEPIRWLFGWHVAKKAQLNIRALKWSVLREWDRYMRRFDRPGCA